MRVRVCMRVCAFAEGNSSLLQSTPSTSPRKQPQASGAITCRGAYEGVGLKTSAAPDRRSHLPARNVIAGQCGGRRDLRAV